MSELRTIETDDAPRAIGPYSQAVATGDWVFCSGQIPIDPSTGEVVQGDVRAQTERVLTNLDAVLRAAGSSLTKVLKTTVFLTDMGDFTAMNEVYGRFFSDHQPARATVQVGRLPADVRVEIECVATTV